MGDKGEGMMINGFSWWQSRDDVGGVGKNLKVKLYYYDGMFGKRWRLEEVSLNASLTTGGS